MTTAHEYIDWMGAVVGDLAVVGVIGAWWNELWANNAHVLGIGIVLVLGVLRCVQSYYNARWARRRWLRQENEP